MNNRLVIYFHYDPRGQADTACRFAVQAMRKQARAFLFVHNGTLAEESRLWLAQNGVQFLERENVGLDVGAYRDALLHIGKEELDTFDEVILMNYTLAGPVYPLENLFAKMDAWQDLDFWGLSRHYAMRSRRFGKGGEVPEHIQSHFIAVRHRMYEDFWQYWQAMKLPASYEESIRNHETRFTRHFAALGYRWDTCVDGEAWRNVFVNPIMGCPRELIARGNCPFFKRRSFFTPFADELRRTDGCAAVQLYAYLKENTDYPVDDLIADLLPVQPLANMAQNLHWHYRLPAGSVGKTPVMLRTEELADGADLHPDTIYCLRLPITGDDTLRWYAGISDWNSQALAAAANLFERHAGLGVLGPALPLYPECIRAKWKRWQKDLPELKKSVEKLDVKVPVAEETPLPLPNGGCLLVRGAAFPQGLPPLRHAADFWLLPLVAQQNGFYSADAETEEQSLARADVYQASMWPQQTVRGTAKSFARCVKHTLLARKEADE